jgi:protein SCO1/2
MDLLGEAGEKVVPIFVTVDPERDTVEVMADYVDAFHPRIVGLTGTPAQIADVAAVYKAGYMKLTMPVAKGPDADDGLDYGMGHSALTYLVGPAGRVLTTYPRGTAPTALMADIGQYLGGRQ